MDPEKTTPIENNQSLESNNTIPDEILELKKKLAEEFADKLSKKNSDLMTSIMKWAIKNYLVDENNSTDVLVDNFIWELWDRLWILPPDIKKYRDMFSEADTKNKLELLRKTILNDENGQVSTADQKPDTPPENSNGLSWETKEDGKEWMVNNNWKDEQPADSKVESNNSIVEKACKIAVDIANDNNYWYEWWWTGNRNGKKWFDCQGFVRYCYRETWINVPPSWWCGTMKRDFEKVWFECIAFNENEKFKPWDILVDPKKHTEMCISESKIAWAHSNKDKKPWDSGWEEISVRDIKKSIKYRNPKYILRYKWGVA